MSTRPALLTLAAVLLLAAAAVPPAIAHAFEVVLSTQGEYADAYLVNGKPFPPRVAFIDPDPPDPACLPSDPACVPPRVGRHVNGKLCFFPRRAHRPGQFVLDKHRQPQPPVTLGKNLQFPDGVTVVRSSRFAVNFKQLPPSPDLTPAECGGE